MRKSILLLLLPFVFLCSCGSEEKQAVVAPSGLIVRDTMVQLLADVHMLEAGLGLYGTMQAPMPDQQPQLPMGHGSTRISPPVIDNSERRELEPYDIFKNHGVTRAQYKQTMEWYCSNPDALSSLYEDVITELSKRQTAEQLRKKD